jgi:DNA-binding CsgD family transcriptional regulator/PAS domain-containing protein
MVTLAELSQVIALIHEAGMAPERWPDALAAIMGLFEGSRIALMDIEAGSGRLLHLDHVGHDPSHAKMYAEHYFAIDPTRELVLVAPALRALTTYEEFPHRVRARHEYFEWAERVCDIGDVIGISTAEAHGRRSTLSLQRPTAARGYDAIEKAVVELLAPHLQIAKRVQLKLGEAWAAKTELEAAFARLSMAALVIDAQTRIRHVNAAATALFARSREASSRHGKLVFADPKVNAAFQAAVRNATAQCPRSSAIAFHLAPRRSAEILVSPLCPEHRAVSAWQMPLALVLIATGARDEQSIRSRMQQLYRLTPAESRIAAALAVGHSVEEIAAANGVTEATLRTQLRSIFGKTGTSRQSQLVSLALRGAIVRHEP